MQSGGATRSEEELDVDKNMEMELVQEIGTYERHFNQIQSNYRTMASTWLLAAFTGIGYLLTQYDEMILPFPAPALIGGICLAVCIGVMLIWVLDIRIYHRLLQDCFAAGMKLEDDYPYLPKIRHRMNNNKSSVNWGLVLFYVGALATMAIIGIGTQFVLPYPSPSPTLFNIYQCIIFGGFAVVALLTLFLALSQREQRPKKQSPAKCSCGGVESMQPENSTGEQETGFENLADWQKKLVNEAELASKFSHSPYSGVKVGAAILPATNSPASELHITGTNVENASYSLTICAERAAVAKAVSMGKKEFKAVALYADGGGIAKNEILTPCGACREVLYEFSGHEGAELEVIMVSPDKTKVMLTTIGKLLPHPLKRVHINPQPVKS